MAKLTLTPLVSAYQAVPALNANNDLIEAAIENTLSRDGTSPNQMNAVFDMNSNRIINLGDAVGSTDAVTLQQVIDLVAALIDFDSGAGLLPASVVSIVDLGDLYTAIEVESALQEVMLAVIALSQPVGASMVGIDDLAGNFTATDVEAALAEIIADYAATTNNNGASKIGIRDAGAFYAATDVEAALAEVKTVLAGSGGAATVGVNDTGGFYTATDVEGILQEIGPQVGVAANFRGCRAYRSAALAAFPVPNHPTQAPPTTTIHEDALIMNVAVFDTDNIFNGANPTRLTVPAGVNQVKLRGFAAFNFGDTGVRHLRIRKNGGTGSVSQGQGGYVPHQADGNVGSAITVASHIITPVIVCNPGDYFEFYLQMQNQGSTTINPNTGSFEMEIIEGPSL